MSPTAARIARAQDSLRLASLAVIAADLIAAEQPEVPAPAEDAPDADWSAWSLTLDEMADRCGQTAARAARHAAENELLTAVRIFVERAAPQTSVVYDAALAMRYPWRAKALDLAIRLDARTVR